MAYNFSYTCASDAIAMTRGASDAIAMKRGASDAMAMKRGQHASTPSLKPILSTSPSSPTPCKKPQIFDLLGRASPLKDPLVLSSNTHLHSTICSLFHFCMTSLPSPYIRPTPLISEYTHSLLSQCGHGAVTAAGRKDTCN